MLEFMPFIAVRATRNVRYDIADRDSVGEGGHIVSETTDVVAGLPQQWMSSIHIV